MNRLQSLLIRPQYRTQFQQTSLGIEREDHRVTETGALAATPHPKQVDGSRTNPYIKRDFAESQLELVTPVCDDSDELLQWLTAIHAVTLRSLAKGERMWPDSMPPEIPEEDAIKVAQFNDNPEAVAYREYLVSVYGKRLQTISGIHFNWGLDPQFIQTLYTALQPEMPLVAFQSELYMKIARSFLRWQWVLVYLFGNSPFAAPSFHGERKTPVRSLRNSRWGYHNHAEVKVSYASLQDYVTTLEANIRAGLLSAEKELYANVRLRGAEHARDLLTRGIQYLEFRLFDIQGHVPTGITKNDVLFLKYFALYLLYRDETVDDAEVARGNQRAMAVAEENCLTVTAHQQEGLAFLADMARFLDELEAPEAIKGLMPIMRARFEDPHQTPAAQTVKAAGSWEQWLQLSIQRANDYYAQATKAPYILDGFEDMELSTQCLIADAIQQGIQVEILDRRDQFLRLTYQGHVEYVREGNITSRDDFISYFKQGNKMVTKQIMAEAGFSVPQSLVLTEMGDVTALSQRLAGQPIVVKPKATNMGIGISIFKHGAEAADLAWALKQAFAADDTVMIESFAKGVEYRFFVLDGETKAVLWRIPANVMGDGMHTIRELVALKNENPLRGENHRTPLTKIQLGEAEQLTLKQQGYGVEDVPPANEQVWLRENSNISTGGDSIDVTSDMDPSYLRLAEAMAQALAVKVTGLDLMIEDRHQPAQITTTGANYTFIESNFNPMMMMHIYPLKGPGRRLTKDMLHFLFPEKPMQ